MKCRFCQKTKLSNIVDLGFSAPSNANLTLEKLNLPEVQYPLRISVCSACFLVQTEDFLKSAELFEDTYTYFSSASQSWLIHARKYAKMIEKRLKLDINSLVVELASNDGYLLQNFKKARIPCVGVEPTNSTAAVCQEKGIKVHQEFFSMKFSEKIIEFHGKANLIIGNNVYAHVPDINDFTSGISNLLQDQGTVTLEFPHLLKMLSLKQFDTIYHEHFSYFSLSTVHRIFEKNGLKIYDVEKLQTHGGSLRVYGCKIDYNIKINASVDTVIAEENEFGLNNIISYQKFSSKIMDMKLEVLEYLVKQKKSGKRIYGYGAAAKGNTLMNYCGITSDIIEIIFDAAESKQGKFTPGSHVPILNPDQILQNPTPDVIIIFPWNIKSEIIEFLSNIEKLKGVEVVTFIPNLEISKL